MNPSDTPRLVLMWYLASFRVFPWTMQTFLFCPYFWLVRFARKQWILLWHDVASQSGPRLMRFLWLCKSHVPGPHSAQHQVNSCLEHLLSVRDFMAHWKMLASTLAAIWCTWSDCNQLRTDGWLLACGFCGFVILFQSSQWLSFAIARRNSHALWQSSGGSGEHWGCLIF